MAIYRSKSAVYAIILETVFNGGGNFTDADTVDVNTDSSLKPEIASIERKVACQTFVPQAKLAGKETGSGSIAVELIGTTAGLMGSKLFQVGLGIEEAPGTESGCFIGYSDAGTTPAHMIYEAQVGEDGTGYLYKLNKPCGGQDSVAIKQMFGCTTADSQSLIFTGVIPNSVQFDFPVADIVTVTFDIGASLFTTASGEDVLTSACGDRNPFIGKNAVFTVSDVIYEAKDVSFTVENTVSDREAITTAGVDNKAVTQKIVKGSLKINFENWDELDRFRNNTDAKIYLELTAGSGEKFAVYIPKARYSSVAVEDDDGILVNTLEFEASDDSTLKESILIGYQP
jgi:hypothetical protein